tara:strand:- start:130 stop:1239 length:1110 start_codon:yes stop_codon:yes gene_type:complete
MSSRKKAKRLKSVPPSKKPSIEILRQSSDFTTPEEKTNSQNKVALNLQQCVRIGDTVEFYLTHSTEMWVQDYGLSGQHLGLKILPLDGSEPFTLGFYPAKYRTRGNPTVRWGATGNGQPGALYIPDPHLDEALKGTKKSNVPNLIHISTISDNAAEKLNEYICNKDITEQEWDFFSKKSKKTGGDLEVKWTGFQYPTDRKYAYQFTRNGLTNCQGFMVDVFKDDEGILNAILPHLSCFGAAEVRERRGMLATTLEGCRSIGGRACGLTKRWVVDPVGKQAVNLAYSAISGVADAMSPNESTYEEEGETYQKAAFGGARTKKRKRKKKRKTRRKSSGKRKTRKIGHRRKSHNGGDGSSGLPVAQTRKIKN